jgi:hypothetical protein
LNPFGPRPTRCWQKPASPELLVAKIRLGLATLLLMIPVINSLFFAMDPGKVGKG